MAQGNQMVLHQRMSELDDFSHISFFHLVIPVNANITPHASLRIFNAPCFTYDRDADDAWDLDFLADLLGNVAGE